MESDFSFNHQYSLSWNDFHKKLVNSFQTLQKSDEFVDVTIACEGKSFSAHKVVLSACSPYFRKLLKANPCPHPIIILQTIGHKHFENLLNFMYHGVANIETESLHDFLRSASALQIQGLADIEYPHNAFNRKASTESDVSMGPMNLCESSEDCVSSNKNKEDKEPNNSGSEKPPQTSELSPDLSSIDKIINNVSPLKNPPIDQPINPKLEPLEDLVIDEDTYNPETNNQNFKQLDAPSFSGNRNYQNHFINHGSNTSDNYIALKKYRDTTGGENSNRCIVCKRNYSSPSNLRAHVLNVHIQTSQTNWFECRVCGKKCKTKHYLINHEMQKHGIRQRSKRNSFEIHNEDTM